MLKQIPFTVLFIILTGCQYQMGATEKDAESVSMKEDGKVDSGLMRAKNAFAKREQAALEQAFIGVRTSAGKQEGLYPIKATGVSTRPMVEAAANFLQSLDNGQLSKIQFPVDDIEWRKWLNVDNGIYERQGVSLKELSAEQKRLAWDLLASSLSARGLEQARNIMKTDQTLKELNNGREIFDEELYFFTVMGTPSEQQPWGWQIDGHHLAINFFVLGDQVVFSPAFMGAEPIFTTTGKHKGNVLFQDEQNLGLALMRSFNQDQQSIAHIDEKRRVNMAAAGFKDNLVLDYQGIAYGQLTASQQTALLELTEQYIGKMRDGHAAVKMSEFKAHLDDTYFGWAGAADEQAVFYYRIHSPVVLIEFDHQGPVGVRLKNGSRGPTRNHIHTMIRTPNGNDYGKDLLKQHLHQHHHH